MATHQSPRGSTWHRWDPHLHTPGTILANLFGDTDAAWESWLVAVESSEPRIRALGVTDYCRLADYERVRQFKAEGRLPDVELIFPNIEMRFAIGTSGGSAINFHFLGSPEDAYHIKKIRRFLQSLVFRTFDGRAYRCDDDGLMDLGRLRDRTQRNERTLLEAGVEQFKVEPSILLEAWNDDGWARDNILIAVAAGKDGTSGVQADSSLATLRKTIEKRAHIIFSGRPGDREFWLGEKGIGIEKLESDYGGQKPCLHGSDAHRIDQVGRPAEDRLCWIKGDITFESLRQAQIEPESRVHIGRIPQECQDLCVWGGRPGSTLSAFSPASGRSDPRT